MKKLTKIEMLILIIGAILLIALTVLLSGAVDGAIARFLLNN